MSKIINQNPSITVPKVFSVLDGSNTSYQQWRDRKLDRFQREVAALCVEISNPFALSHSEHTKILTLMESANLVAYQFKDRHETRKESIHALGVQLGLTSLDNNLCADGDSITSLQVSAVGRQGGYIPYTSKPLNWHTDGYYNAQDLQIKTILMHCVRPAAKGGENQFLDPEMLYILLREENPDWVAALLDQEAMVIPPNVENGVEIRGAVKGPVFSEDAMGNLHMRYTARTRSIEWKAGLALTEALAFIQDLFRKDSMYIQRHTLASGQGIISHNVIHNRSAFEEDEANPRLLYRARYFQRVQGCDFIQANSGR